MIPAAAFCAALAGRGIRHATGVPCSYLSGPIAELTRRGRYLPAANEGAALAIAAGAVTAGTPTAVLAQNSGLGNLVNPLTSLALTYGVPVPLVVSLRGYPDPDRDEVQHAVMGRATHAILDAVGVRHWTLGPDDLDAALDGAVKELAAGRPAAVLVPAGTLAPAPRVGPDAGGLERRAALAALLPLVAGCPVVGTTGHTSRDLFALGDRPTQFYLQGSMGHAAAYGLGLARHRGPGRPVVVLDGDGAALMHLGTMSTIGAAAPVPLLHVVLDNGSYESTGLQATTSAGTDFAAVALACGYRSAVTVAEPAGLVAAVGAALAAPGPHLVAVRVAASAAAPPPRATAAVSAGDLYRRFRAAVR